MTEKEVLERIRNPDSWDEDLFQLYDQMEPNLSNLEPDTYRDFCTAYATWKQKVLELKRQEFDGYVGKANDLAPAELRDLWDKQLQSRPFDLIHLETNEETGKVIQCVRNFEIVLEEDSRFSDKIRYNEFSGETFLVGSTPWEQGSVCRAWTPTDDSQAFSLIQIDYGLRNRNDFFDALRNISAKHRFHPVREMLESLRWDGQEHIQQLLPDYLGAACTSYNYEVLRLWMLGGVARVFQPGTKVDNCLILCGNRLCGSGGLCCSLGGSRSRGGCCCRSGASAGSHQHNCRQHQTKHS